MYRNNLDDVAPIEITNEVLDRMQSIASVTAASQPYSGLDYSHYQQVLTLISLQEFMKELGIQPQFTLKVKP